MDEIELFPIWIFSFFLYHVFPYAVEHLVSVFRRKKSGRRSYTAVDFPASVALGLSRHPVFGRRGAVRFRLLQCNAYLHRTGIFYHDIIQAPLLVRVLPYGNNDAAYLQGKSAEGRVMF